MLFRSKYRKVSLPREEIDGGLTPGKSFPVFDTDFGRIGLMTCWDVFFPESARSLAGKGAEIIFLPIWGGNLDLARARAIENQVYLVSSTYDMKTGIFNREGKLIVEGSETDPVAVALGAQPLDAEESENYSIGAVFQFGRASLTIDAYRITHSTQEDIEAENAKMAKAQKLEAEKAELRAKLRELEKESRKLT